MFAGKSFAESPLGASFEVYYNGKIYTFRGDTRIVKNEVLGAALTVVFKLDLKKTS